MFSLLNNMAITYITYACTRKLLVAIEVDKMVHIGYITIDVPWIVRYCYIGKSSNGLPALRFKPTTPQKREIVDDMQEIARYRASDYHAMMEPYSTYINCKGIVKTANKGVRFEHWAVETIYGQAWHYNTDAHIYHTDVADVEIKTCYNSTFMTWATYQSLQD